MLDLTTTQTQLQNIRENQEAGVKGPSFGEEAAPAAFSLHASSPKRLAREIIFIILGALLFSASMNLLVVPCGMYNGGFLGIAQLLRILFGDTLSALHISGDIAGYIYFLLNLPLLLLSFRSFGHFFFFKTVLCVICYSLFLALIPVPAAPLLEERIAICLIGGLACGTGAAITLTAGCSGGGEEILGLLFSRKNSNFSVGKFTMMLNVGVFGAGFLFFDPQLVAYSIIFATVTQFCLDRVHLQNIMITMIIITKLPNMEQMIFDCVHRGVTKWEGHGGYSNEPSTILLTVVSKKEALVLKDYLKEQDPNVFIILNEDVSVTGNFQKRI